MLKRFNYMDDSESNESRQVTDIQVHDSNMCYISFLFMQTIFL
jgi:hypothetical protein